MRVAGVDGTRTGWVAIVLDGGRFSSACLISTVTSRFEELEDVDVIAIDVPIGFGPRRADAAARAYLRGAASTVFTTPTREDLQAPFGPGRGISAQSHALGPRILHVTDHAAEEPRLFEVHPEVSFRAMNDGEPLNHRKKSAAGALLRIELLRRHGIELGDLGSAAAAPLEDVLDAAAGAWSANRIAEGVARKLPDPPEVIQGRDVAIWF